MLEILVFLDCHQSVSICQFLVASSLLMAEVSLKFLSEISNAPMLENSSYQIFAEF